MEKLFKRGCVAYINIDGLIMWQVMPHIAEAIDLKDYNMLKHYGLIHFWVKPDGSVVQIYNELGRVLTRLYDKFGTELFHL